MAQFFQIHPQNPQLRLIHRTVDIIRNGGVVVYPTDSLYALGCRLDDKQALDRIRRIRQLDNKHNFTLVCKDVAQISNFAKIGNDAYRMIKAATPGPFTFILKATREVPRRLQHTKRKSIGIRIPDHAVAQSLVESLNEPLCSSTLLLPGEPDLMMDLHEIRERLQHDVDLIIDSGSVGNAPTTVVNMVEKTPEIIRQGKGQISL